MVFLVLECFSDITFTIRTFSKRFYPKRITSNLSRLQVHSSEERETTIHRCLYSKEVHRRFIEMKIG